MRINQLQFSPVEKNGQRVLTTAQLAEAYETTPDTITRNFNRNKNHYKEGVHFYLLKGTEITEFFAPDKLSGTNSRKIRTLYLWTERGALLHAKSLNTEKAWAVYEFLVDNYFHTKEIISSDNNSLSQINEFKITLTNQINDLNKRFDVLEKKIDSHADNIIKTLFDMAKDVIANGFETLHNNFLK